MHRRNKTSDVKSDGSPALSDSNAAMCTSPGHSNGGHSSDESGEETDSSERSFSSGRVRRKQQKIPKRRRRLSRPAVEDIIDGFAICSFETIKDLTLFVENKTVIHPYSNSSSSESDYEPARPSFSRSTDAKIGDAVCSSSPSKYDRKAARTKHRLAQAKFVSTRTENDESSDRSLSPASVSGSSLNKSVSKSKPRTDVLKSGNRSSGSVVSISSVSGKNQQCKECHNLKESSESIAFSCVSCLALKEEDDKSNVLRDLSMPGLDEIDELHLKAGRSSVVALTDAESESSVVLIKEELKETDWTNGQNDSWTRHFPIEEKRRLDMDDDKRCVSKAMETQSVITSDSGQGLVMTSSDYGGKWNVIKEMPSLLKTENILPSSAAALQSRHRLSPLESRSSSLDRHRTIHDSGTRHVFDLTGSTDLKTVVGALAPSSVAKSDSSKKVLSGTASSHVSRSMSNECRPNSTKARSRDGSSSASKGGLVASSSATLASMEIKNECPSPISVRGSSSRQSSSRSSTSHKKSSNSVGNDFSSLPFIERNVQSPLTGHSAYHPSGGRPLQPTAYNIGSLPISGLFAPPLPQIPVPGLRPSGGLLGPSMGLHPSLMAPTPLMAGMNSVAPIAGNPDLFQVQQELNNRFLQDHRFLPLGFPPVPLTLRTETHQHQHLHHHQHLVPTPYMPSLPGTFSMASHPLSMLQTMGPSGIDLLSHSQTLSDLAERERLSKLRASLSLSDSFLPPSYSSLIPGILPTHPTGLTSNMHGAFTINETKSSMSASHLLRSLRNDQQVAQSSIPPVPTAKKKGRWCAAHMEIACRIFYHKQRSMQLESAVQRRPVATGSSISANGSLSSIHGYHGIPGSDAAAGSISNYHQPHLHFGVNSFLRPTPQSLSQTDTGRSLSSSSPFTSRPRHIATQPGGITKVEDGRDLKSASSSVMRVGHLDSGADQDRKRRLNEKEVDCDDLMRKKRRPEFGCVDHRMNSVKSERSSPRLVLNDKSSLQRSAGSELSRTQRLPPSHSPFVSSEKSSRPVDVKKRDQLTVPLSVDTCNADGYHGDTTRHVLPNVPPLSILGGVLMPNDKSGLLQVERERLPSLTQLHRDPSGQSYYGQSLVDGDRYRSLIPSHPAYGLPLSSLTKPEHESFKPYADLGSRLDAKPVLDGFKQNPDGLFIVSSSTARPYSMDGGGLASNAPPPLVRLPLDNGLSSFKRHAPYGSIGNGLPEFSSSLCGLPGVDGGFRLPFR